MTSFATDFADMLLTILRYFGIFLCLLGLLVALCWCAERLTSYVNRKFGWWPSMFVGVALALVIVALFATIADRQLHRRSTELDDLQQGEMELILWSTEHYLTSDSTAITP